MYDNSAGNTAVIVSDSRNDISVYVELEPADPKYLREHSTGFVQLPLPVPTPPKLLDLRIWLPLLIISLIAMLASDLPAVTVPAVIIGLISLIPVGIRITQTLRRRLLQDCISVIAYNGARGFRTKTVGKIDARWTEAVTADPDLLPVIGRWVSNTHELQQLDRRIQRGQDLQKTTWGRPVADEITSELESLAVQRQNISAHRDKAQAQINAVLVDIECSRQAAVELADQATAEDWLNDQLDDADTRSDLRDRNPTVKEPAMALMHTPAHTTDHPDHFVDDATGNRYSVVQDTDSEDPRTFIGNDKSVLWAFRQPRLHSSVAADYPEGNFVLDAFRRFYEAFNDERQAVETTTRWLLLFHPEDDSSIVISTIRGYSQSDWLDVVAVVSHGYGTPAGLIDEFRMWAFGDVWTVVPDQGSALSGIYADSPEEAVEFYREHHESQSSQIQCDRHGGAWGSDETCEDCVDDHGRVRPAPRTVDRTLHLQITAADDYEIESKLNWIIGALDESDALPAGVRGSTEPFSIDSDWQDDVHDVSDADHVEIGWTSRDARGRVLRRSDAVITPSQATAMFTAIGATQ